MIAAVDEFRYAAFISYRHVDPDRRWAVWLHRALERYRVPRATRREVSAPARIGRVFRDEDEVSASSDLTTEIEAALRASRWLIVVCSPRVPSSRWVNREIVRFRELGRGDRILALLIEGEPDAAFPPSLREIRDAVAGPARPDGGQEDIEPLAADVRESRLGSRGHARTTAKLRIVSAILGCRFDDLRRRHQQRQHRRVAALALAGLVLAVVFGVLAVIALTQRDRAREAERRAVIQSLVARAREALTRDPWEAAVLLREIPDSSHSGSVLQTSIELLSKPMPRHVVRDGEIEQAVAFAPDGRSFLTASARGVHFRDLASGAELRALAGTDAAFSHGGSRVAIAAPDFGLRVVDTTGASPDVIVAAKAGEVSHVSHVAFSPDDTRILGIGRGRTARVWNADGSGDPLILDAGGADIQKAEFSPNGKFVAMGCGYCIRLWELGVPKPIVFPEATPAAFSPDGNELLILEGDRIKTVPVHAGGAARVLGVHADACAGAWSPDGKAIVTCGASGTVRLWHVGTADPVELPWRSPSPSGLRRVDVVAFSPQSDRVAAGSWNGVVHVWDLAKPDEPLVLKGHDGIINAICFSPGGAELATAAWDYTARIWDLRAVRALEGSPAPASRPQRLPPDVSHVVADAEHHTIRIAGLANFPEPVTLRWRPGGGGSFGRAGLSPDGTRVTAEFTNLTVLLWDLRDLAEPIVLRDTSTEVCAPEFAAFSPDGRTLFGFNDISWSIDWPRNRRALWKRTRPLPPEERRAILTFDPIEPDPILTSPEDR
jgi:WD40 repeat protein